MFHKLYNINGISTFAERSGIVVNGTLVFGVTIALGKSFLQPLIAEIKHKRVLINFKSDFLKNVSKHGHVVY